MAISKSSSRMVITTPYGLPQIISYPFQKISISQRPANTKRLEKIYFFHPLREDKQSDLTVYSLSRGNRPFGQNRFRNWIAWQICYTITPKWKSKYQDTQIM